MTNRFHLGLFAVLLLNAAAHAADPYGLEQQRREWRTTEDHYAGLAHAGSRLGTATSAPVEWKSAKQRLAEYEAALAKIRAEADEEDAEDRAWAAHNRAAQRARQAENERIRRENALKSQQYYEEVQKSSGEPGTHLRPPVFYTDQQAFRWYLSQAQAGDKFAAFWVGRAFVEGHGVPQSDANGLIWLEKSDLQMPEAAALLGRVLLAGRGVQPEPERARKLLQQASDTDKKGIACWLYATALRDGIGLPKNAEAAALHLCRAIRATPAWEEYGRFKPRPEWAPPAGEFEARALQIRRDLRDLTAANLAQLPQWLAKWEAAGEIANATVLLDTAATLTDKGAIEARLGFLDYIESRKTPWSTDGRREELLLGLRAMKAPGAGTRSILPWNSPAGTGYTFISLTDEEAVQCWKEGGAQIQLWARQMDALSMRARMALMARAMGRWPAVSPVQSPAEVVQLANTLGLDVPIKPIFQEILRGKASKQAPWNDDTIGLAWIDAAMALTPDLKDLRSNYLRWRGQNGDPQKLSDALYDRLNQTQSALQARGEKFSAAELDEADLLFNQADEVRDSNPAAAYDGFYKAFERGHALAGWQMLDMASGPYYATLSFSQYLINTTDSRLRRDAQGEGDRAATAALALHFLHNKDAFGSRVIRGWVPKRASEGNYLELAAEKGHPWAVFWSNPNATEHAFKKSDPENQRAWQWIARNFPLLDQKRALWQRDCRLLELQPPDYDMAGLQPYLNALQGAEVDAHRFRDAATRLESARALCASYAATPGALNPKKAGGFRNAALDLTDKDHAYGQILPVNRSRRLENWVQAAIYGDASAPLQVGLLLQEPDFPLQPDRAEAGRWITLGEQRLTRDALKGAPQNAVRSALILAEAYKDGGLLAQNNARAIEYFTLAAQLGDASAANELVSAYKYGELGLQKNPALAAQWDKIAGQIYAGKYKVPVAALQGRAK